MTNYLSLINNTFLNRKYPLTLVHLVTNRCNVRCSFCFINFDDPKTFQNELSLKKINNN